MWYVEYAVYNRRHVSRKKFASYEGANAFFNVMASRAVYAKLAKG
jgi:hypothetical protein